MTVDENGFAEEMEAQKTRSKQAEAARRFVSGLGCTVCRGCGWGGVRVAVLVGLGVSFGCGLSRQRPHEGFVLCVLCLG